MVVLAKYIIVLFGLFLIVAGFVMLFKPLKAKSIIGKAGSTNFINYTEISIRMIPAAAMFIYADYSKFPEIFKVFGGFTLATSFVLYFAPRKLHPNCALKASKILKPFYIQLIVPFSNFFGFIIAYFTITHKT
jgi:uncharacterized membrane protein YfcA